VLKVTPRWQHRGAESAVYDWLVAECSLVREMSGSPRPAERVCRATDRYRGRIYRAGAARGHALPPNLAPTSSRSGRLAPVECDKPFQRPRLCMPRTPLMELTALSQIP